MYENIQGKAMRKACDHFRHKLLDKSIKKWVKEQNRKAGTKKIKKFCPYSLRHFFSIALYHDLSMNPKKQRAAMNTVSLFMGHSKEKDTQLYVDLNTLLAEDDESLWFSRILTRHYQRKKAGESASKVGQKHKETEKSKSLCAVHLLAFRPPPRLYIL